MSLYEDADFYSNLLDQQERTQMTKLVSILVGAHFVPPAKVLLEHLPGGAALRLVPVEDNPYDEHAVEVWVDGLGEAVPEGQRAELGAKLPGMGYELAEVLASEAGFRLGHVAASDGKPINKALIVRADLVGNREFRALAVKTPGGWAGLRATLGFDGAGLVLVEVEASP